MKIMYWTGVFYRDYHQGEWPILNSPSNVSVYLDAISKFIQ